MPETTTPTEEVVDNPVGSEQTDLPTENTNESAVESVDDTASEESTDNGSNNSTQTEEEPTEASADLKKFAKGQGYTDEDLASLTPREIKALSIAQKQVSNTRKQMQAEAKEGIEKTINSVEGGDMSDREYLEFKLAQRDMVDNIRDYWQDNPDDQQYQAQAIAVLENEKKAYGEEAMLRLAGNLPRLMREAKFQAGAFDTSAATEKGRKEERERLNKLQQGAADGMDARTEAPADSTKDDADFLRSYDPSDPEQRKRADEIIAKVSRGRIY